jgi:ABC-2 type transport system permease protein
MSAATTASLRPIIQLSLAARFNIYFKEAKYEFLKLLRLPIYSLSTILFPVMFYVLFGLLLNRGHQERGVMVAAYLMATYGTLGVMGASLFGFGAGLASERGLGWLEVKRASPMPPFAYFAAKTIVCMAFSLIIILILLTLGVLLGGVQISLATAGKVIATLVLGASAFCAMGMAIGYFAGPNSAPAIVNLMYLPMSFASGLWIPIDMLPRFLQKLAPLLPPYHLGQLALGVVGVPMTHSAISHWQALAGFTLVCLGIARIGFQRSEDKSFG